MEHLIDGYPFSPQQIRFYMESTARINLASGSVRSGKSFIALYRFLNEIHSGPPGKFLFAGKSERTIRDNIIDPMNALIGGAMHYYSHHGYCQLGDRRINVVGANDERSVGKIQGNTYAGALVDEVATLPQGFFDMLMTRLSVKGAKLFGTTNPDSPYHWLKTEYIDKLSEDQDYLRFFEFTLEDNPNLDKEYIDFLKAKFSGLWYQRYIEGKWVLAQGCVYDFFNEKLHVRSSPPTYAKYYILGVDYGTANAFAAVLVGYNDDHSPTLWVEKEYYWDARKEGRQKTDAEYAQEVMECFAGYPIRMTYIDPSAASFGLELRRNRWPYKPAKNEVIDGIRFVSTLLSQGDLVICSGCRNLIKEFGSYVWDENAAKHGEDKPVKQRDHALDALRYSLFTAYGAKSTLKESAPEDLRELAKQKQWQKNPMAYPGFTNSHGWQNIPGIS